jgi:NAD(P)-dependent dehydrogenase (short-subunit alcohol dehydrogenase family)
MGSRLEGKVAVVTGGGNGIGRACCVRFAEEGARVVVADLLAEAGKETVDLVTSAGGEALLAELDAADRDANRALMQTAVDRFGALDVLVTAAGISFSAYTSGDRSTDEEMLQRAIEGRLEPAKSFVELDPDDWQRVLDVNLTGTFHALQAAAERMLASGSGGSIVTIASVAAKRPDAGPVAYTVSKAGVWMLTKAAARALGPAGIRVNAIGPGFIDTNMTRLIRELPGVSDLFLADLPLRRFGEPVEVANAALFLASDESSYFTGELLHPDGGFYTD